MGFDGRILIGTPILHREWILPTWFEHVARSCGNAGLNPQFVFVGDPARDEATWRVVHDYAAGRYLTVIEREPDRNADVRDWTTPGRIERMVHLRNLLLERVRKIGPAWFLSLDSDVLVHPGLVANLVESSEKFGAVGGKLYMTRVGTTNPSFAQIGSGGGLVSLDTRGVHTIGVVMACVMMSPAAYAVDYEHHQWGEDIGHAYALRRAGVSIGADGRVGNHHVMEPSMLFRPDARVGWPWAPDS